MSNNETPEVWFPMEEPWQGDAMLEIKMVSGPILIISTRGASLLTWNGAECWRYRSHKEHAEAFAKYLEENEQ